MVEMNVSGVILEPKTKSPIVVLKDAEERRALLIWVGEPEANAILLGIEEIKTPRPLTHDLFRNTLTTLGAKVVRTRISAVRDNTFFAELLLDVAGQEVSIDARPSDAIALAIRFHAVIEVSEDVMASSAIAINQQEEEVEAEQFRKFLDEVKPSDFGKFGGAS